MTRTEWAVDNEGNIRVKYVIEDNEIHIAQGKDLIYVDPADAAGLVQALVEAIGAVGVDMPDLNAQGYISANFHRRKRSWLYRI